MIDYLRYKVLSTGITSERHIKAIADYPVPKTLKQLQSFLGLASYFRKFIRDYSLKAHPLHQLTRKETKFIWDEKVNQAFLNLKKRVDFLSRFVIT